MVCFYWICNVIRSCDSISQIQSVNNLISNFNLMFDDEYLNNVLNNMQYKNLRI